jgi:uncharacterized protein YceK
MKKLTLLLIAIILLSCGSVKKDKTSIEIESKSDFKASKIDKSNEVGGSFITQSLL